MQKVNFQSVSHFYFCVTFFILWRFLKMLQQINFNFDKLTSFKVLLTKFLAYCVACALRYCLSKNLNFFNFLICENSIFAFLIITFVTPCTLVFIYSCKTRTILGFSKNIILFLLFNSH